MKNALTTPPSPAKEKTTWGAVCQQVGFADNLYKVCRDRLGNDFTPSSPFGDLGSAYDEDFDPDYDFDKALRSSILPPPKAPPKNWKPEPEGLMEQFMSGDLTNKIMLYGGGAIVLYFLYDKYLNKKEASAPAGTSGLSAPIAEALHLPLSPQVSDTAPTTVAIPASLRI